MKRKALFLLLLMAMFAPLAMNGQETVTIGDGTAKSYYTPFNSLYWYSFTEMIYPASEITIDDETVAGTITSVSYYLDQSYTEEQTNDIVLYMKNVTRETFASTTDYETVTASDIVFNGQWTIPANTTGVWLTITLDTPFEYDGESNLMIAMDENTDDYSTRNFRYTSVTNSGIQFYHDTYNPDPYNLASYSGSKTLRAQRPNIQLVIEPASTSDCEKPETLVADPVTAHGATLTWSGGSGTYNVEYKKASQDWTQATTVLTNTSLLTTPLTGLDDNTAYIARVTSICGTDSNAKTVSFTTPDGCPEAPSNLRVTLTPGDGTVASLNWDYTTATQWQICLNGDETNLILVNSNPPYGLTGLTPETACTAKVRTYCSAQDQSGWSNTVTFTPTDSYNITLNDGTNTNTYVPIHGSYCDYGNRCQFIIPAASLSTLQWATLDKLTFYANANVTSAFNGAVFKVYMAEVSNTVFESQAFVDWATLSTVYNGSLVWSGQEWVFTLDASNPFTYQGGNLLIGFQETSFVTDYTYASITWLGVNQTTNTAISQYANSSHSWSGTITYRQFLPKVTIDYTPGTAPSCLPPTGLTVTENSVTAHQASITWTENGNATSWDICVNDDETNLIHVSGTPRYDFTNLAGETTYSVKVLSNCSSGDSNWSSPVSFTTLVACPAPTALACTAYTATTASFSWTAGDSETNWVLQYGTDNTFASGTYTEITTGFNTQATPTITFNATTGITAETVHYARVQAVCGGIDGSSDWSNTVSFEPSAKQLITGETTGTNSNLPSNTNYDFSYTQQIYTVAELGTAGLIESIDFYMTSTSNYTRSLDIYMVATDKNSFTGNSDWINVSAADLVFSGSVAFIAQSWTTITLDDPFIYDGSQNVAIIVDDNTDAWSSRNFSTFTAEANQSLYASRDDTNIDPSAPSGSFAYNSVTTAKNQIRILKSELSSCMKPTGLAASEVGPHSVVLSWTENGEATAWVIDYNGATVNAPTNPFTLTGLTPETTYTVKVRPICDENLWSNGISFTTDVACPAPTLQPVSGITNNSATISWTGSEATDFNVRYVATASINPVFFEDFESGIPNTWTTIDADGDGNNWLALSEISTVYSDGYSSDLSDWAHSGSNAASSPSYYNSGNNSGVSLDSDHWLISPQVSLGGILKFYVSSTNSDLDSYEVLLSTTGTATTDFTVTLQAMKEAPYDDVNDAQIWEEVVVDLGSYVNQQGYIAIHHVSNAMYFLVVDDFGIYNISWQTTPASGDHVILNSLTDATEYQVQVQAVCGGQDGSSDWSSSLTFETLSNCSAPAELYVTELTNNSAKLNWTGAQTVYNVRYRKAAEEGETTEDFSEQTAVAWNANNGELPSGWYSYTTGTYAPRVSNYSSYSFISALTDNYLLMTTNDTGQSTYAIMPQYSGITGVSFNYAFESDSNCGNLEVGYVTDNTGYSTFTRLGDPIAPENTSSNSYSLSSTDIATLNSINGYIAFKYNSNSSTYYSAAIDDVVVTTQTTPAGAWNTDNHDVNSELTINNLTQNTKYEWQVQGINASCDGGLTDWSASATFTTLAQFTKTIAAVGDENWAEGNGGYYLIASPLADDVAPTAVDGMITADEGDVLTYDLYSFDQTQELEWQNYRTSAFNLVNGMGYLYASKEGTTLTFTGAPGTNGQVTLSVAEGLTGGFPGWNLVGNPFGVDAYITKDFYTLENSDTYTENTAGTVIHAMQGLLVVADNDEETLTFSTEAPAGSKVSKLNMNVSKDSNVVDHAIISFSEGHQLPKLQFRQNSTKVYLPKEGKDYAIVSTESNVGEIPVSFKAEKNGSYTLSFTSEEVTFSYLHLIDNMTGNDVNLLETPSYTFDARTSDYESRFRLVFATGTSVDDNTFGFVNAMGNFCIFGIEGEATVQVIDMLGHVISSETFSGSYERKINGAPGVYLVRLINGDNVMVQKIVVR